LQIAGVNFKAFDLGGHEIARKVWKDYYAKVNTLDSTQRAASTMHGSSCQLHARQRTRASPPIAAVGCGTAGYVARRQIRH
jgi:hypothetical protein